ncbi:hypothetical protein LJC17_05310, partial [Acholeplasma sp. OttesenSCG-928-E16]|nr:hypothetical protein [Acholeplasma sp. OttesenSCG-928-E16]
DEAKRRLDQLEIDLQNEIYESQEDIKKSIKEIAFLAAEKIVEHEIDEKVHSKTVDKVIEEKLIQ